MNHRARILLAGMRTAVLIVFGLLGATHTRAQQELAPGVFLLARFQNTNINESSGLLRSHRTAGAYWTHNDGDNNLFAFTRAGRSLGKWSIPVPIQDFEDIAWSPGRIYIGDIGNGERTNLEARVYAVPEPGATFSGGLPVKKRWRLKYPDDQPFDAESLLVHRRHGYIISKQLVEGSVGVYRFPLRGRGVVIMEAQCRLNVNADVGGADLTRDGNRLAVITDEGPYLFTLPGTIPESGTLEPVLQVPLLLPGMEACCFTRDGLLVTTESGEILLFTDIRFRLR